MQVLSYYYRVLKGFTFYRAINLVKLLASYHYSRLIKRAVVWGAPASVSIEPGTACNLRCPQCPSGLRAFTRNTGMLDPDLFSKMLDQLGRQLHTITLYFQGEPYLHPQFTDLVEMANRRNIFTITSTNAHYLSSEKAKATIASGLCKLIISVDGTDQESYSKYRVGGDFEKVIAGTKTILAEKKASKSALPHVVWQFVVFKHNEHQIEQVKELGKQLGVDEVSIKTAQVYDFENGHDLIPQNENYARYKLTEAGNYIIKNKLLNQCWRMWQGCVLTWDGSVVPCCFDKDAKHQMGSLKSNHFQEIWHSQNYAGFRNALLTGRNNIDICKNCTEGTKVFAD